MRDFACGEPRADCHELLDRAGFERPEGFFSSLLWSAWLAWRRA
ncbi:hypothetical protein AB4Z40_32285 [Bosea sp. 2YAB26]|jgi:hypothetical protein